MVSRKVGRYLQLGIGDSSYIVIKIQSYQERAFKTFRLFILALFKRIRVKPLNSIKLLEHKQSTLWNISNTKSHAQSKAKQHSKARFRISASTDAKTPAISTITVTISKLV